MTEANNNANSGNSETSLESLEINHHNQGEPTEELIATANQFNSSDRDLFPANTSHSITNNIQTLADADPETTSEPTMNWQKVAHKLREYNRKLLKKVFRLEQELAEIDNRFNKYVEKSRNSDRLVAHQESEIQQYQEQIAVFSEQLATSQATIDRLAEKYQSAQQQTAQLERECTLLQEKYNHQVYELTSQEKSNKELQTKLSQQQRYALQYQAELKRYREQEVINNTKIPPTPVKSEIPLKTTLNSDRHYTHRRSIQPWSTISTAEAKITLPKTQIQPTASKRNQPSETIKTAAEIATWSASQKISETSPTNNNQSKSSTGGKPQSLAAVDLPTFPRPL